jgi:hypothetical protein
MKQKSMVTIAVAALAISLAACDDSSSGPSDDNLDGLSSETVTSSETAGNPSDGTSSTSQNGTSSASQNGNSSTNQDGVSSASQDENSSTSQEVSSSGVASCAHITDNECRITQGCSLTPCMSGTRVIDCARNLEYICNGGTWEPAAESSSSETPSSTSNTPKYTNNCVNISGVTGNDRWNCNEEDFTLAMDCKDNTITYMCVSKRWFKTEDCDPTKPGCGYDDYTLCLETRIKEYCLKTEWLNESCSYGKDPMRWLFTYAKSEDEFPTDQIRYACNKDGHWEEFVQHCDSGMDCGNNKSDDKGILPDGAPCQNVGEQMTVEGYNYQCINNVWTRL